MERYCARFGKAMTSGPVVAMVLSGNQAVGIVAKLAGAPSR